VKATYGDRVVSGVGGFACLYKITEDKLLAAGTDGVGTKLKIAQQLNIHDTIGIDLVAMCVNDILCTGARPLFFMDYLATGALDVTVSQQIISGVAEGCRQSEAALIGGETAEMPGMYSNGEYDLAGFAVGEVMKDDLVDGSKVKAGDSLIGLASSGFHSNGYSLLRKTIPADDLDTMKACLTPTRIYVSVIKSLIEKYPDLIKGMAHITGGGLDNIPRINGDFSYDIHKLPSAAERPDVMNRVFDMLSESTEEELCKIFNMGIGFVLVTDKPDDVMAALSALDESCWVIGKVTDYGEPGSVSLYL
jgi:phosphoribosylformylglycinamidine cyclo-ligase